MNTLGEALKDAYGSDELRARGGVRDPRRTIATIRRRRTARAAGTGSAAAVVVAAIAFGATAIPGLRTAQPALPGVTCVAHPLALANPMAFGALEYVGRSYIDDEGDGYVFVHADGTAEELALDPDGAVRVDIDGDEVFLWAETMSSRPGRHVMDWVRDTNGVQGAGAPLDPDAPQPNTWAWNVEVPDGPPEGVNVERLSWLLLYSMRGSGGTLETGDVPEGAIVEIAAHGPGTTWTVPVAVGATGPGPDQTGDEGLTSLELIVTLPDGGTYTMTARHDANAVGAQICVTPSPDPSVPTSQAEPTTAAPSSAPTMEPGTALSGPEAGVFACGAALRPELEGDLGLDVTWQVGAAMYPLVPGGAATNLAFGAGGVRVMGIPPSGPTAGDPVSAANWAHAQGGWTSLETFAAVAAVRDGVIVGVVPFDEGIEGAVPGDKLLIWGGESDGPQSVAMVVPNVDARMRPCDGGAAAELEGAETVVLLGSGGIGGPYEFAWTVIEKP